MSKKTLDYNVLIVGQTGAGKSTFLNYLFNYFEGNEYDERSVLIKNKYFDTDVKKVSKYLINEHIVPDEKDVHDEMGSKTQTTVGFHFEKKGLGYNILDTPGIGDTRGIDVDQLNISNITQHASNHEYFNSITLVINGTIPRLSDEMTYVLNQIRGFFPNDYQDALTVILTNTSQVPNFKVQILEEKFGFKVSKDKIFQMDNGAFTSSGNELDERSKRRQKEDWKYSMEDIEKYLHVIRSMKPITSVQFKAIKEKRDNIRITINSLINELIKLSNTKQSLKDFKFQVANAQCTIEQYKDFSKQKTVKSVEQEPTSSHNTVCTTCNKNCHLNCGLDKTTVTPHDIFKGCACMSNGICKECGCDFVPHVHRDFKFVEKETTVSEIVQDIKDNYDKAVSERDSKLSQMKTLENDLILLTNTISQKMSDLKTLASDLKKLCNGFNFVVEFKSLIQQMKKKRYEMKDNETLDQFDSKIKELKTLMDSFQTK